MAEFYATFRYHPTEAPAGRKFTDKAEFLALSDEWVDTPAKFPAQSEPESAALDVDAPVDDVPKKRSKKSKETVQ